LADKTFSKALFRAPEWLGVYGLFWRERFADLRKLLKEIDP
jgi:hypothetical protein